MMVDEVTKTMMKGYTGAPMDENVIRLLCEVIMVIVQCLGAMCINT